MIWDSDKPSILPSGWMWTTVGTIYDLVGGGTPSTKVPDYWKGDVPWITSADIHGIKDIRPRNSISHDAVKESATNIVAAGSLVVVTRVGLGKMAIADRAMCFSQDCQGLVLQNELMDRYYSLHYLSLAVQIFKFRNRGTTIGGVTTKQLRDLAFPLAPLPEQHRIVERLEALFSELDKGIERLQAAREQLRFYRHAVLKHAFEGKLTEKWRKEHASELKSAEVLLKEIRREREEHHRQSLEERRQAVKTGKRPSRPTNPKKLPPLTKDELAELPENMNWIRLGECAEIVGGVTKGRKLDGKETIDLPYLRVANVQEGYLDLSEMKTIKVLPEDLDIYRLLPGDVLYTEGGDKDKLGRGTIWHGEISDCIHQNHIFRARLCHSAFLPEFVSYYSQAQSAKTYFFKKAKQTVNLASINMTVLSRLPIPLLDRREQLEIVQQIESRLSIVEQLERTIDKSLQKAEAVRQSVLKKAFEGRLVQQDPNDESASVLLERMKAEKAKQREKQGKTKK